MNIAGKTVLLTGASGGLGEFIARALAKEHATVVGVSRSKEKLDKICAEVEVTGGRWRSQCYKLLSKTREKLCWMDF